MTAPVRPTGSEVGFALSGDSGWFGKRTLVLVRSIRDHYPDSPVLTFVPDAAVDELDDAILSELRETTTVETGPFPIPEYPHSAFQEALYRCAERFGNCSYYIGIDSDAVLLNRLTLPCPDADLYATGMYMGGWPWQAIDGITDDWYDLFDHYDIPTPEEWEYGLLDGYPMWPPYYNSGILVTSDADFPRQFRLMNQEIFSGDLTDTDPSIETEQVCLALFAADPSVNFVELSEYQNWMMGGFWDVPDDVEVLHYQYLDTLSTLSNRVHAAKLESYGVQLDPGPSDHVARILSYLIFNAGRVLRHRYYMAFSDVLQPYLDWNNPET